MKTELIIRDVGDLLALLRANLASSNEGLRNHAATLCGPRTRGSTTTIGLEDIPPRTSVREIEHENVTDDCRCFMFEYDMGATFGAIPYELCVYNEMIVAQHDGEHGKELVTAGTRFASTTKQVYVIVGEHEGEQAIFTWHPGQPLRPFREDDKNDYFPLRYHPKTGVKLI